MEGWVDLGSPIVAWPVIELTTAWSQVRRPNRYATPLRHLWYVLRDFLQISVNSASLDNDELIRFWGPEIQGQDQNMTKYPMDGLEALIVLKTQSVWDLCWVFLLLGWPVFWAGVASMQSAVWCWMCYTVDDKPVAAASVSCSVFRWPAALLVQRFTRHFICRHKCRGSSWWIACDIGQHSSKRDCLIFVWV